MKTFIPFAGRSFIEGCLLSLLCLDNQRLGKQRVEAFQIYKRINYCSQSNQWNHHPACLMWRGYQSALAIYLHLTCIIWKSRTGKKGIPFVNQGMENNLRYYSIILGSNDDINQQLNNRDNKLWLLEDEKNLSESYTQQVNNFVEIIKQEAMNYSIRNNNNNTTITSDNNNNTETKMDEDDNTNKKNRNNTPDDDDEMKFETPRRRTSSRRRSATLSSSASLSASSNNTISKNLFASSSISSSSSSTATTSINSNNNEITTTTTNTTTTTTTTTTTISCDIILPLVRSLRSFRVPWWWGIPEFHDSDKAALYRKAPNHYALFQSYSDKYPEYVWPHQWIHDIINNPSHRYRHHYSEIERIEKEYYLLKKLSFSLIESLLIGNRQLMNQWIKKFNLLFLNKRNQDNKITVNQKIEIIIANGFEELFLHYYQNNNNNNNNPINIEPFDLLLAINSWTTTTPKVKMSQQEGTKEQKKRKRKKSKDEENDDNANNNNEGEENNDDMNSGAMELSTSLSVRTNSAAPIDNDNYSSSSRSSSMMSISRSNSAAASTVPKRARSSSLIKS